MKSYNNHRKKENAMKNAIPALAVLIIALVVGLLFFRFLDSKDDRLLAESSTEEKDYVEIEGIKCKPKQNIETYLFLGTDIQGKFSDYTGYDYTVGQGHSDVIQLLVIDKTANTYATLAIDRNTMTEMGVYNPETESYEEEPFVGQICMAYAAGYDGKEHSCENVANAVSELLYGQKIDACFALGLGSIQVINHQLGGITVTIKDDFGDSCPTLIKGQTKKLTDEEAMHFCHDRMELKDDTNTNRMSRQKEYLAAAKPVLMDKCKSSDDFILNLYDALSDYSYTSLTRKQISKITKAMLKNEDLGEFSIEGEEEVDEETGYIEFYPEIEPLAETVVTLFYNRVE